MPPHVTFRVVSSPPMRRRSASNTISSSPRRSPSTSPCTSTLTRSSVGFARRSAIIACAYSAYSPNEVAAASIASAPPFSAPSIASDQRNIAVPVLGRDAQHVADHDQGQRRGEVVAESHSPRSANGVDEVVAGRSDARRGGADPRRRERAAHEPSPLPMRGRVHVDHPRERPGLRSAPAGAREDDRVSLRRADRRRRWRCPSTRSTRRGRRVRARRIHAYASRAPST